MTGAALASPGDLPALLALRRQVFVEEQGVPAEIEQDHLDQAAVHAVARDATGRAVGTGRLVVGPATTPASPTWRWPRTSPSLEGA